MGAFGPLHWLILGMICLVTLGIPLAVAVVAIMLLPKRRQEYVSRGDRLIACPDCGRMVSRLAVTCPQCGRMVSRLAVTCPQCGRPMGPDDTTKPMEGSGPAAR
jgi:hypothetical protein